MYPELDTEVSGYRAEIHWDSGDGSIRPMHMPGRHATFEAARDHARRIADALKAAGETGLAPWVGSSGEKPAGFPRNGVKV